SGETAEVLSAADAALEREIPLVALSAGGRLAELAKSRRLPHLRLPGGLMPRMALGYLFFALARILTEVDLVVATHAELAEAVARLESLARELGPTRATAQNEAKRLALAGGAAPGPRVRRNVGELLRGDRTRGGPVARAAARRGEAPARVRLGARPC